ncbi:MAG: hypothetical protein AB7R00_32275 [Kofleriaceae bacterium]
MTIVAIVLFAACSKRESMLERHRKDLTSTTSVIRKLAAASLVRMCCPMAAESWSFGPPPPRNAEGIDACGIVTEILRTHRDPVVVDGVLEQGWYPECVVDIPAQALLAVLRDLPPPRTRFEIVVRLSDYETTPEIVDAFFEELRRPPGSLPSPLHERVAYYLSNLGERELQRAIDVMISDSSITARRGAAEALRLAATDPIALPHLEEALEAASGESDEIVASRAKQALTAYRESAARDPELAAESLAQRLRQDAGAIQRLGTRRISCSSRTAAAELEKLTTSPEYWKAFWAKRALTARAKLCGLDASR